MTSCLVRAAVVRATFVVLVLLAMVGTAFATPEATPAPGDLRVAGGLFTPTRTGAGIDWHARWVLTPESAAELAGGETRVLRFALPLTGSDHVEAAAGVVPFEANGHTAGLMVERAALDGRSVSVVVHQRVALDRAGLPLAAPIAAGTALQIVDGDLGAGTRFEIETGRVLERSVGYVAAPGVSHNAREEARRLTGYGARVTGAALYVRGDDVRAANGITANLVTPHARAHYGTVAIGILFGAVVVALFVAVKRLRHAASLERADAVLAAEVDALDRLEPQHALKGQHS